MSLRSNATGSFQKPTTYLLLFLLTKLMSNNYVKGSGGFGLTENPVAFRRWMLSGPELARLLNQFEEEYLPDRDPENPKYFQNHEQGFSTQKLFQKQVNSLVKTIEKMDNPFLDDFPDLVTLDSRNCVDESVVLALHSLEDTGIQQYKSFVKQFSMSALNQFMTQSRRILLLFSNDHGLKQHQSQVRRSNFFKTMWHSSVNCTYLCKVVMVT